jgi:hypothetical protein
LFSKWDLDPATAAQVISVVRERESRVKDAMHKLHEEGLQRVQEFSSARRSEFEWAEIKLLPILGVPHFEEFSRLESEMESEMFAKASRITQDMDANGK